MFIYISGYDLEDRWKECLAWVVALNFHVMILSIIYTYILLMEIEEGACGIDFWFSIQSFSRRILFRYAPRK